MNINSFSADTNLTIRVNLQNSFDPAITNPSKLSEISLSPPLKALAVTYDKKLQTNSKSIFTKQFILKLYFYSSSVLRRSDGFT